jgi:hypothetical protein
MDWEKAELKAGLLLLIALFWMPLAAQVNGNSRTDPMQYPFICHDSNYICNPAGNPVLQHFYDKLDTLLTYGTGRVTILHIGGSHIQTDVYTHHARVKLLNMQPDLFGGRGLIFPVAMTGSNNPKNFSVSWTGKWDKCKNTERNRICNLGVTGMAVTTTDSFASITLKTIADVPSQAHDLVRIFHFDALDSYTFNIPSDDPYLINSITAHPDEGYTDIRLNYPVDTFTLEIFRTNSQPVQFELYGIELLLDGPGIVYHSIGVNGASLPSFIKCNLFQSQLKILNPDLVIISLGTNDGFTRDFDPEIYKRNYIRFISMIREACPGTDILMTVPNDVLIKRRRSNKNTPLQEEVIYEVASDCDFGVWNFFRVMGGPNSVPAWYINGLMQKDRVHFTVSGYKVKGELFFEALMKSYSTHLELNCALKEMKKI